MKSEKYKVTGANGMPIAGAFQKRSTWMFSSIRLPLFVLIAVLIATARSYTVKWK
jgi:hypothetical protein